MLTYLKITPIAILVITIALISCKKDNDITTNSDDFPYGKVSKVAISKLPFAWNQEPPIVAYDITNQYAHIQFVGEGVSNGSAILVDINSGQTWNTSVITDILTPLDYAPAARRTTAAMRVNGNKLEWLTRTKKVSCDLSDELDPDAEFTLSFTNLESYFETNESNHGFEPNREFLYNLSYAGYKDIETGRSITFDWNDYTKIVTVPNDDGFLVAGIERGTLGVVLFQQELNGNQIELNRLNPVQSQGGYQILYMDNEAVYARNTLTDACYRLPADGSEANTMTDCTPVPESQFKNGLCFEVLEKAVEYKLFKCDNPDASITVNGWLTADGDPIAGTGGDPLVEIDYHSPFVRVNHYDYSLRKTAAVVGADLTVHAVYEKTVPFVTPKFKGGSYTFQNAVGIDLDGNIYRIDAPY